MQKIMLKFPVQVAAIIVELDGEHIGNDIADSEQLSARVCILQRIVQAIAVAVEALGGGGQLDVVLSPFHYESVAKGRAVADGVRRHRLHAPRVVVSGEDRRTAGVVDARDAAEAVSPFNYESITMCRAVFLAAFHYGEVQLHPDYLSLLGFHHESLSFVIYDGH